jgi:hypothetical protein
MRAIENILSALALTLLVLLVRTNDPDDALTAHDLALVADPLH